MKASFYVVRPGNHLARYLARDPSGGVWWVQQRCKAWYGPQKYACERAYSYQIFEGYMVVAAQR